MMKWLFYFVILAGGLAVGSLIGTRLYSLGLRPLQIPLAVAAQMQPWHWWCLGASLYVAVTLRAGWRYARRVVDWYPLWRKSYNAEFEGVAEWCQREHKKKYPQGVRPVCAAACAPTTTALVCLLLMGAAMWGSLLWLGAMFRPTYTTPKGGVQPDKPLSGHRCGQCRFWYGNTTSGLGCGWRSKHRACDKFVPVEGLEKTVQKNVTNFAKGLAHTSARAAFDAAPPRQCGNCKNYKPNSPWCKAGHWVMLETSTVCKDDYEPKSEPGTDTLDFTPTVADTDPTDADLEIEEADSDPSVVNIMSTDALRNAGLYPDGEMSPDASGKIMPIGIEYRGTDGKFHPVGELFQQDARTAAALQEIKERLDRLGGNLCDVTSCITKKMERYHTIAGTTRRNAAEDISRLPCAIAKAVELQLEPKWQEAKQAIGGLGLEQFRAGELPELVAKAVVEAMYPGTGLTTTLESTWAGRLITGTTESITPRKCVDCKHCPPKPTDGSRVACPQYRDSQQSSLAMDYYAWMDGVSAPAPRRCGFEPCEPAPPRKCVDCKHCPPKPPKGEPGYCDRYKTMDGDGVPFLAWLTSGLPSRAPHLTNCFEPGVPEGQCCGKCVHWRTVDRIRGWCAHTPCHLRKDRAPLGTGSGEECEKFVPKDNPLLCNTCIYCPEGLSDNPKEWGDARCKLFAPIQGSPVADNGGSACGAYKPRPTTPKTCGSCAEQKDNGGTCIRNLPPEDCGHYKEYTP